MKTFLPLILCFLFIACKTVDMTVLNDVSFYAFSKEKEEDNERKFPFVPLEYQQQKAAVNSFWLHFKKDSLFVTYDSIANGSTIPIVRGFKGKQKRPFWRYYAAREIVPYFPIYMRIYIHRLRLRPTEEGNLRVDTYIDREGAVLAVLGSGYSYKLKHIYKRINDEELMIPFFENGKYGINKGGKLLIPAQYDYISAYTDGFFIVEREGKWGTIDKNGQMIIPLEYDALQYDKSVDSHPLFIAQKERRYGFLEPSGVPILPLIYSYIEKQSNERSYILGIGNKVGYFTYNTNSPSQMLYLFIPAVYSKIGMRTLNSHHILVYDGLTPLFIDHKGNEYDLQIVHLSKWETFMGEKLGKECIVKIDNSFYKPNLETKRPAMQSEKPINIQEK